MIDRSVWSLGQESNLLLQLFRPSLAPFQLPRFMAPAPGVEPGESPASPRISGEPASRSREDNDRRASNYTTRAEALDGSRTRTSGHW
jgi:hypothetical protein